VSARDLANIIAVFEGSDAAATIALYDELKARGPEGLVAMELFRIQKASSRAKVYRGGGFRGRAYDKKQWAMDNLCRHLRQLGTLRWGWKIDPAQAYHNWVLYVDLPNGQVSFHTAERGEGPDYPADWDGVRNMSPQRICRFVADVFAKVAGMTEQCFDCGMRSFAEYARWAFKTMLEPWPHKVYYHRGWISYVDPQHVFWSGDLPGPSDCVWIVPGTLERQQ